jgi:hypothetical protein
MLDTVTNTPRADGFDAAASDVLTHGWAPAECASIAAAVTASITRTGDRQARAFATGYALALIAESSA